MARVEQSNAIRMEYRAYNDFPAEIDTHICTDVYTLFAPLRRASLKIASDSLRFEGETRPGMLRMTSPGERAKIIVQSPVRHVVFAVPGAKMRRILDRLDHRSPGEGARVAPLIRPDERVARAAASILAATKLCERERQLFVDGVTHAMLACLLHNETRIVDHRFRPLGQGLSQLEFDRCCDYADAMMEMKLDLDEWAATAGMSATEFVRRFRQFTKLTPYAWFLDRRIERAKVLLREGVFPIVEVALALGFSSQSHFTEAFRRRAGCSPARWRSQFLNCKMRT